ncbi:hypothetical protein BGW36DRAFT_159914 [Talaromyces proteolyticus]|uniref:Uncharacterized protein n=1 Tax=Talaromyces proteolyticus TaxID=1131652 RepID=A0AAD4KRV6_9EURO|nr:uncharacterized protein BGW36DRAFT_159914 [Talaromyces proteolyticus]KAH8697032.1 hypothetical protein BGW36DRAFT_159914 [Talaromyces proteolyticus]
MTFYIHDTPWLLAGFSLLTVTISTIIKPSGRQTFIEDAKCNILSFSPIRSGTVVVGFIVYLIHLRLLNIAGIHTGLKFLSYLDIESELSDISRGFWPSFARRAFLIGGTLPLYAMLLVSTSYQWLHVFTTCLVAESVLAELLSFFRGPSDGFTVRKGWPHRTMLMAKPLVTPDHLSHDHVANEGEKNGIRESKGDGPMAPSSASKDNLCDRIQQLWSTEDLDINFAAHSIPPEYEAKLERIFSLHVRYSRWTCGHWRCFVYISSRVLIRIIFFSWYIEQASTAWLLHLNLHPVTLRVSDKVLGNNILGGLLTMLYQVSLALTLFASGFISPLVLIILLRKKEPIKRAFQDLAETAPITYKVLEVFGKLLMPSFMGWLFARVMYPQDVSLTREMVSYAIEIVMILIIYITGYRLLLSVPRSEHTEPQSNSGPSLEPNMSPNPQNRATTAPHQIFSNDKKKAPRDKSKYRHILPGPRFQIFRLVIWIPTVIISIFRHYQLENSN